MSLLLGQLVYTSFFKVGFRTLVSAEVPKEIQQAFIQQVVYQHWNPYKPPSVGYRAAYIHQVTLEHTLFGWLYNDGIDDLGRSHVPYFVCYYLAERLHAVQLANIFTCLQRGPVELINRLHLPSSIDPIVAAHLSSYQPARKGVEIPLSVCEQLHISLQQKKLLKLFVPSGQREILVDLDTQCVQQTMDSRYLKDVELGTESLNSQAESVPIDRSAVQPLILPQPDQVEHEEFVWTAVALEPAPVKASLYRKFDIRSLKAVAIIVVVGVSLVILKFWQPSAPPIILSREGIGDSTLTPENQQDKENNYVSLQTNIIVPGFPIGTPESIVKAALGEPTKTSTAYLPNIDTALYDLVPNQITLSYLFDRYSRRIRQTEVSFAQSIDSQLVLATLNGLLGKRVDEEIQQGLQQVYEHQSNQYAFVVGSLKGVIKRNNRDRIYIGLWETSLY